MKFQMPFSKKLNILWAIIYIPLAILLIYVISSFINYGLEYNRLVKTITQASSYLATFKDELDYSVYRTVINEKTYEELIQTENNHTGFEGDRLKNSHIILSSAKSGFKELLAESRKAGKKPSEIVWSIKYLERLEELIEQIENNILYHKPYSINEKLLNNGVYLLTEAVEDNIRTYIDDEAEEMEILRKDLERSQGRAITISVYSLLLILTISLIISQKITTSITIPLKELCKAAEQTGKGDFTSISQVYGGDEIQTLTNSFNHMKVEIGKLIEDVKREQGNLRAMELKLLQAQINPHFLYNTLDAIVWLAETGKNDHVVAMVTSLSEFFRTVLSEGKDSITIQEEVSHIDSYLRIQQFRYSDILEYEINVDKGIYTYQILKLSLQPIVENALYHGIKHKRGCGKIIVTGERKGENIVFSIIDNGIGMSPEKLAELMKKVYHSREKGGGFGLSNVHERLQMTYGEEYGLSFESKENQGTKVSVTLPADTELFRFSDN